MQTNVKSHSNKKERIEARLTAEQKALIQRAADLQGYSLSEFILTKAQEAAKKVIYDHEIIVLSAEDSLVVVEALINPPKPNEALRKAYKQYKDKIATDFK